MPEIHRSQTATDTANIVADLDAINTAMQAGGVTQAQLAAIKTAVEIIDNFISGARGLVTEDNSANILTAVQLIDDFVGTIDSAFSGKVAVLGGKAESGVPTEVADADAVALWIDTFGRLIQAGYNLASGALDVTVQNWPLAPITNAFTALTAAGSSSTLDVSYYNKMTLKVVVASINTSVDYKIECSPEGTNFKTMEEYEGGLTQIQQTADGTYLHEYDISGVNYIRFTFAAEAGGTDVTLTPTVYARA